ncbi:peptidoglycan recognition protein family protein [Paraburkholderia sartisoli]|uniref:N-acetylmuramoyl-L-alanine amidase n=1 Tax=Paraburkholderia sartisoli TaxID=83784 RepID=A0A1H4AB05_9BURK|nr:peptidoglycan recognition family protein [Paraburkholderia sartisoli]SEA32684.1 N-acetylmuramoyl-L-alanine amidase [Paraburkholderia sartisoli]
MADYDIVHWTSAHTSLDSSRNDAVSIFVDDRAATRQAIITRLKARGYRVLERSSWEAKPPTQGMTASNWNYRDIVIHHAGHSYSCAVNAQGSIEQMKKVQDYDMATQKFYDVGYHYAVSCPGEIIEARDIRFIGSHVLGDNTGKLGIVLLENLAEAGEAWQQEYSRKSLWQKLKGSLNIARDAVAFDHAMPTQAQIDALSALIATLKEFFDITAVGGHREYQRLAPNHEGRACPGKYGMQIVKDMRARFSLGAPSK